MGGGRLGKNRGRPKIGDLVDMAIYPESPSCFLPDDLKKCELVSTPFLAEPGHKLGSDQHFTDGTSIMEAFAVWHSVDVDDVWHEVARIDTWHGAVHQHQFFRDGAQVITELAPIPARHGTTVIELWSLKAEIIMQNGWEEHFRRWNGDGE